LKFAISSPVLESKAADGIIEVENTVFIFAPNRHDPAPVYYLDLLYHGWYIWQLIAVLQLNCDANFSTYANERAQRKRV